MPLAGRAEADRSAAEAGIELVDRAHAKSRARIVGTVECASSPSAPAFDSDAQFVRSLRFVSSGIRTHLISFEGSVGRILGGAIEASEHEVGRSGSLRQTPHAMIVKGAVE